MPRWSPASHVVISLRDFVAPSGIFARPVGSCMSRRPVELPANRRSVLAFPVIPRLARAAGRRPVLWVAVRRLLSAPAFRETLQLEPARAARRRPVLWVAARRLLSALAFPVIPLLARAAGRRLVRWVAVRRVLSAPAFRETLQLEPARAAGRRPVSLAAVRRVLSAPAFQVTPQLESARAVWRLPVLLAAVLRVPSARAFRAIPQPRTRAPPALSRRHPCLRMASATSGARRDGAALQPRPRGRRSDRPQPPARQPPRDLPPPLSARWRGSTCRPSAGIRSDSPTSGRPAPRPPGPRRGVGPRESLDNPLCLRAKAGRQVRAHSCGGFHPTSTCPPCDATRFGSPISGQSVRVKKTPFLRVGRRPRHLERAWSRALFRRGRRPRTSATWRRGTPPRNQICLSSDVTRFGSPISGKSDVRRVGCARGRRQAPPRTPLSRPRRPPRHRRPLGRPRGRLPSPYSAQHARLPWPWHRVRPWRSVSCRSVRWCPFCEDWHPRTLKCVA